MNKTNLLVFFTFHSSDESNMIENEKKKQNKRDEVKAEREPLITCLCSDVNNRKKSQMENKKP